MERLKNLILEELILLLSPKAIYEKSVSAARKLEGLADNEDILFGDLTPEVTITENGIEYIVSIEDGQKTGFFLDQREMRKKVMELASGRRVLNCFAYTGGFSLAALKGGAVHVDSVDICPRACDLARRNNTDEARHSIFEADAFEFLKNSPMDYDLVILDPPAFAKKRADVTSACQGYKEINRRVLEKIPARSFLLTSSCSSYIDDSLFQNLIFQASLEAKRNVRIVGRHILAMDHPISIYHPEGDYLKSLLLYVV
jgi:23S rRNA (cytosine1962-C5)-methyltransferase